MASATSTLLILALLHLVELFAYGVGQQVPDPDQQALVLLARSLNPSGQIPQAWQKPTSNWCNDWFKADEFICVTAQGKPYLTSLRLTEGWGLTAAKPLQGAIPHILPTGAFSRLTEVHIQGAGVIGSVPQWLLQLPALEELIVEDTSMSGRLPEAPPEVCSGDKTTVLKEISFHNNTGIQGVLPASWACLSNLRTAQVQGSGGITGSLPGAWSRLRGLDAITLSGNGLKGSIPPSWANLSQLTELDLSGNQLDGVIGNEWSDAAININIHPVYLNSVNVSGNQDLHGCVPDIWTHYYGIISRDNLDINGTRLEVCANSSMGARDLGPYNITLPGWSPLDGNRDCSIAGYTYRHRALPEQLSSNSSESEEHQLAVEHGVKLYTIYPFLYPVPFQSLAAIKSACDESKDCVMFTTDGFLIGAYRTVTANVTALRLLVQQEQQLQQQLAKSLQALGPPSSAWALLQWYGMAYCPGPCCGTYVAQGSDLSLSSYVTSLDTSQQLSLESTNAAPSDFPGAGYGMRIPAAAQLCRLMQQGLPISKGFFNCPQRCKVGCCDKVTKALSRGRAEDDTVWMDDCFFAQCAALPCHLCGFEITMAYYSMLAVTPYNGVLRLYKRQIAEPAAAHPWKPTSAVPCANGGLMC